MHHIQFGCLPTMIGSMPQKDAGKACTQVIHYLKDIPAWPQLSKRAFLENMYVQYSQGFPGVVLELEKEKIYIDRSQDLDQQLEKLYMAYLENNLDQFPITQDYAAGLHKFLGNTDISPLAVKGQVIGPVSWGMTVPDNSGRAIAYDDILADAAAKLLRLKAAWQERELRKIASDTIIFVDEPYMTSFGSAFFALTKEKVVSLLEEVLRGISGLKGVHCCGNTDWSLLLGTSIDILSFDAYNYAESLTLYPTDVKKFLERNGTIAWGIVPNEVEALAKETASSLHDRLEEAMAPFTRNGMPFKQLIAQSLLTPSCGLERLATGEASGQALQLLAELSSRIRKKYSL